MRSLALKMRIRGTHASGLFAVVSLLGALAGCRAAIPDGRFGCTESERCPDGFSCVAGVCRRGAGELDTGMLDGGMLAMEDTGMLDGGMLAMADTGMLDGGARRDTGLDAALDARGDSGVPRTIRVLDAIEDVDGRAVTSFRVSHGGETRDMAFGCVTSFTVPAGVSSATLSVSIDSGAAVEVTVVVDVDLLVVLARTDTSIGSYVLADEAPAVGSIRYLDVLRSDDLPLTLVPEVGGPETTAMFGRWTSELEAGGAVIATARPALAPLTQTLVASFSYAPGAGLAVLTGNAHRHPGAPGGPRLVLVPSGAEECLAPSLPDPELHVLNLPLQRNAIGGGPDIFACQVGAPGGARAVNAGSVSAAWTSYNAHTVLGFSNSATGACGATARLLDADSRARAGSRYLVVVSGAVDGLPSDWRITLLQEPTPPAGRPDELGAVYMHAAPNSTSETVDVLNGDTMMMLVDPLAPLAVVTTTTTTPPWTHGLHLRDHSTRTIIARYGAAGGTAVGGGFVVFADSKLNVAPVTRWAYTVRAPFLDAWSAAERRPML
jgi:hypothetical protein